MRSSNAYCAVHQHKICTMWPFNKTFAVLDHPGKESSKVVLSFHDWLSLSIMDKGRKKLPVILTFLATVNNAAMNMGIQIYFWAPAFSSLKWDSEVELLAHMRSLGEGNGNPLQYSCLKNSMDKEPGGLQSRGSPRIRHDWDVHAAFHKGCIILHSQTVIHKGKVFSPVLRVSFSLHWWDLWNTHFKKIFYVVQFIYF